jgi:hypothetical protein
VIFAEEKKFEILKFGFAITMNDTEEPPQLTPFLKQLASTGI